MKMVKSSKIQSSYLKSSPHILKLACYGIVSRMISLNSKQKGHKYSLFKEPSIFATLYLAHAYSNFKNFIICFLVVKEFKKQNQMGTVAGIRTPMSEQNWARLFKTNDFVS